MTIVCIYRLHAKRSGRSSVTSYTEVTQAQTFPDVTICNVNPLTSDILISREPEFGPLQEFFSDNLEIFENPKVSLWLFSLILIKQP